MCAATASDLLPPCPPPPPRLIPSLIRLGYGSDMSWAQAAEAVRAQGDVAVGLVTQRGARLQLVPRAEQRLVLERGDKLVVLSPGYT